MKLIEHPTFPDQRKSVRDEDFADWEGAGWVLVHKEDEPPSDTARERAAKAVLENKFVDEPVVIQVGADDTDEKEEEVS